MYVFRYEFERRLRGDHASVRQVLINRLRSYGCKVDRVETNVIEGRSRVGLASRVGREGKPPMVIRVLILDLKNSVQVNVQLLDAEEYIFDPAAFERRYTAAFHDFRESIDEALRQMDPNLEAPPSRQHLAQEALSDPKKQMARALRKHAAGKSIPLTGSSRRLHVMIGDDVATLEPSTVQALMAVSSMALSDPTIPQPLLTRGERIRAHFADFFDDANGSDRLCLDPSDRKIFEFLYRQALIRGSLPMRELYRCLECDYKKVTNPEYQHELSKSRLTQTLVGGVTNALMFGRMSLIGVAARTLAANSRDFVCPQCQGTKAEVRLVALCPRCRKLRAEPVLRTCATRDCGYDFMGSVDISPLWTHPSRDAEDQRATEARVKGPQSPPPRVANDDIFKAQVADTPDEGECTEEASMNPVRRVLSIFVSQADADIEAVQPLRDGLRHMHYEVLPPDGGPQGQHDFSTVLSEIERSDVVLIALSPHLLASERCASERAYASHLGKQCIVVCITETDPQSVPGDLAGAPTISFIDPGPASAFELADLLARLPATPAGDQNVGPGAAVDDRSLPQGDSPSSSSILAGWYPDPTGRHQLRWYDGDWSDYASDNGATLEDPL